MKPYATFAALVALTGLLLCAIPSVGQEKKKKPAYNPKDIHWKLKALDDAPLKVIKSEFSETEPTVFWVIELKRDFDVFENGAYWGPAYKQRRPRFRFELHDENGIVLKTVDARYIGEYVNKAGKRFGAQLELPPDLVPYIKTVEAVPK